MSKKAHRKVSPKPIRSRARARRPSGVEEWVSSVVGVAVVAYVLMNLALSLFLIDDSVGSVRLLSGHLLLFYLIPLMYFLFVEPRLRDGGDPPHP